ncbi:MAG: NADH-quinone oxidoreductase subunit C [Chloroflexi bacterium]|nr:NADH-quinone oxidoreductase subunit C [Chloroflexota bacterium]MBK7177457.1 NADH-quinone oxidoreductase subunit C [Chloroflexota bacterium]MBP6803160.1 NADH-quinone oxidoreductase subunit C [Chloroflexota bacterium]MBP7591599.1 NADH-quinone oxidoreductase subunit C [Chloroflexota bacterium]
MLPEFDNKSGQSQAEQALSRVEQLLETWREKLNKPQPSERTLVGGENPLIFPYAKRRIMLTGNGRPDVLDISVHPDELLEVVQTLLDGDWGYLITITGLDLGPEAGEIEILYHFAEGAAVVTLSVRVERETAVIPSICPIIPSASFFERELVEMLGITILNTPNTDHLFLPDDWPADTYPLRKEFNTENQQAAN